MYNDVHQSNESWDCRRRHEACVTKMLLQAEGTSLFLKLCTPLPIANEQELDLRTTANQRGCDRKESIVPLQFEQARELANDDILRPDAEFRSQSRLIIRPEKWFEIEPAETFSVLLTASH